MPKVGCKDGLSYPSAMQIQRTPDRSVFSVYATEQHMKKSLTDHNDRMPPNRNKGRCADLGGFER